MSEKISATIEDYLGVLLSLEREGEPVSGARLANLLSVSPPTVTNTLKRMARDGLVVMDATHTPHLTEQGVDAARSVMRKHMLAEWMLARMVSWSKLHKEAHEFEHVISSDVEAALFEEHHHPDVCPHGNPLPGREEAVSHWTALTDSPVGVRMVIRRIHEFAEENDMILSFLEEKKIAPGQEVIICESLPFNQTVTLNIMGEPVTLGFSVARFIYAETLA